MDFAVEFRRILDQLDASGIDVAVVGGWALAVHGVVRATVDIDLLARAEQSDEDLRHGEAAWVCDSESVDDPSRWNHRHKASGPATAGLERWCAGARLSRCDAESVWDGRGVVEPAFGRVPVVSLEGLAALKRISGRPHDLEDLRALARGASPVLDNAGEDDEANADRVLRPVDRGYSL